MCAILVHVQSTPSGTLPSSGAPDTSPRGVAGAFYAATYAMLLHVQRDLFERLRGRGLSSTQFKMLHRLATRGDGATELSIKALGDQQCLSLAAASRAIDGLVQRGYVEREECPTDRRVKRVRITDAGRTALAALHDENIAALTEFTQTLTDEQRHDLAHALAPLLATLGVPNPTEGSSP